MVATSMARRQGPARPFAIPMPSPWTASGNLYIATGDDLVHLMDTSGNMVAFLAYVYAQDLAINSQGSLLVDLNSCCYSPYYLAYNPNGYFSWNFLGNAGYQVIAVTPPSPTSLSDIAGVYEEAGFNGDGVATSSWLLNPTGLALDGLGNLFINDYGNYRVRRVDTSGNMTTVAGTGSCCFGGDNYPLADAIFNSPFGVAFDGLGNMFIADRNNQRIREVNTAGTITTVVGNGTAGAPTPGPATSSSLSSPMAIAADAAGNLYIADTNNNSIEKVDTTGQLAILTTASQPQGITLDGNGNVYFSDTGNSVIRKLDTSGNLTIVAGIGTAGFSGDGGSALAANLNTPAGVAVDPAGNLYIADTNNQRIREVGTNGDINTIAGTGACYLSNDGPALSSALCNPFGLSYVASTGSLLISEPYPNTRVRILYPSGNIKTVAGSGGYGFSGDGGSSYSAALAYPYGITTDGSGNLYIADTNNQRIREVTGAPLSEPPTDLSISQTASATVVSPGSTLTYTLTVTNNGPNPASAIVVNDTLDPSLTFVSCSTTGSGTCGGSGNARTVNFDSLPNGNSEVITFAATVNTSAAGTINNTASVTSGTPDNNVSNNTSTVAVTVGAATATLSATSLNFGNQGVNTTSASKSFTISNTGNASLTVTGLALSGLNPGDFSVTSASLPVTLPAGTNVLVNVSFTPAATGTRTAAITVNSNASNGQLSVALSGNGVAATSTALQSSLNPSYAGQSVTFTATVSSSFAGSPTGTVTFKNGGATLGTAALTNGTATFSTSTLPSGSDSIRAVYSGDSNYLTSTSATLKQVVNALPASTATKLVTSGSPSFVNQSVTFTATITSSYGPIPSGETVTFYDGTTALGTGLTAGGQATFSTSALTAKTHSIMATYAGDANFKASSGTTVQVVNLYSSSTTLSSNLDPSTYGQMVGLSATVASNAPGGATGTVTFKSGNVTLGSSTVTAGTATLNTAKLSAGTLSLTATYNGDAQSGKSSGALTETVNQATTTTSLISSLNPSNAGQTVKFTATVSSPTTAPTGTVTFMDGTTVLGTASLAGGKASYSTSTLSVGSHTITAVYGGTANIGGSTSMPVTQTVN